MWSGRQKEKEQETVNIDDTDVVEFDCSLIIVLYQLMIDGTSFFEEGLCKYRGVSQTMKDISSIILIS